MEVIQWRSCSGGDPVDAVEVTQWKGSSGGHAVEAAAAVRSASLQPSVSCSSEGGGRRNLGLPGPRPPLHRVACSPGFMFLAVSPGLPEDCAELILGET